MRACRPARWHRTGRGDVCGKAAKASPGEDEGRAVWQALLAALPCRAPGPTCAVRPSLSVPSSRQLSPGPHMQGARPVTQCGAGTARRSAGRQDGRVCWGPCFCCPMPSQGLRVCLVGTPPGPGQKPPCPGHLSLLPACPSVTSWICLKSWGPGAHRGLEHLWEQEGPQGPAFGFHEPSASLFGLDSSSPGPLLSPLQRWASVLSGPPVLTP